MSDRILNARIIQIHDTESNWNRTIDFIPRSGEIVVYDVDSNHALPRIKIGNGTTDVKDLPFTFYESIKQFINNSEDVVYLDGENI